MKKTNTALCRASLFTTNVPEQDMQLHSSCNSSRTHSLHHKQMVHDRHNMAKTNSVLSRASFCHQEINLSQAVTNPQGTSYKTLLQSAVPDQRHQLLHNCDNHTCCHHATTHACDSSQHFAIKLQTGTHCIKICMPCHTNCENLVHNASLILACVFCC